MKLVTKINRNTLLISAIVFITGNILFHFITRQIISEEADEALYAGREEVLRHIDELDTIPHYYTSTGERVEIMHVATEGRTTMRDTLIYEEYEGEKLPYRELTFYTSVTGEPLKIILRKSLIENDELLQGITMAMLILTLVLFSLLYWMNYRTLQKNFHPFYRTLDKLRSFDLASNRPLHLEKAGIKEFSELNQAIMKMSGHIRSDYVRMKEFTENTSHELQTSLAVIQARLELLLQNEKLDKRETELVESAYESVVRLSRLNKGLLLLARIGNNQFSAFEKVRVDRLIEDKLVYFSDWIKDRQLDVKTWLTPITLKLNPQLAEILISNLITNAIKHNVPGGKIDIHLSSRKLTVINTGKEPPFAPEEMFQRFRTTSPDPSSTGLGLAIIKQVCDLYGFDISYCYSDSLHKISIRF